MAFFVPIDLTSGINQAIALVVERYGNFFHSVSRLLLQYFLIPYERIFLGVPPWLFITLLAVLTWFATRKIGTTLLYVGLFYLLGCFGLWEKTMQTLSLTTVALLVSLLIGLPIGIGIALSPRVFRWVSPVLNVMQTFPMFVYMLPAVMLFSIGKVPALFATVIYALPPLIRLTDLGIRQVDVETREAARSFGANTWQILKWVQLPLARPSILAGINQNIMLALSMVVVASMIGTVGLGQEILYGITNLDFGRGLSSGIAIVVLAFILDRITQAYGLSERERKHLIQNKLTHRS